MKTWDICLLFSTKIYLVGTYWNGFTEAVPIITPQGKINKTYLLNTPFTQSMKVRFLSLPVCLSLSLSLPVCLSVSLSLIIHCSG